MTSSGNEWRERLQRRLESERRESEELIASEQRKLVENLRSRWRDDLHTIEADTRESTGRLIGLLARRWFGVWMIGLSLCLGIFGGSWGLLQWLSSEVRSERARLEMLREEIVESRRTLARLEEETWGVLLVEDEDGKRFVVLPRGTPTSPRWGSLDGRPVYELSSE